MADRKGKAAIIWEDSDTKDCNADACTVAISKGEISLIFGTEETENKVRFTNRIILNPLIAKQLAAALEQVITDHEHQYGLIPQKTSNSTEMERKEKASALFDLIKGMGVSMSYEQSFKVLDKTMLANRFLVGISKKEIAFKANDRIAGLCERLNMPHSLMEVFRQCLFDVNYIHFGYEEEPESCLYKVYVEFWDSIKQELKRTNDYSKPYILHLGFKWDPFNAERKALTRYTWHPHLTGEKMLARVSEIAEPGSYPHIFETVRELLDIAMMRMPYQEIRYLEVAEQDNPRKSFDINIYRAGVQVGEAYKLLARLGRHYGLSKPEFHKFYNGIKANRFGHLSGGINREGKDFCTVYHGIESIHGESRQVLPRSGEQPYGMPAGSQDYKPVEDTDERAIALREMIKGLDVPFGFERSFKMAHESFLPGRFLTGFQANALTGESRGQILDICRKIQMPESFLSSFEAGLPEANYVLFGFEKNEKARFYKIYLEFTDRLRKAFESNPDRPEPFLMFIGFKWDILDPSRKIITDYTCYPSCVLRDMRQKASNFFSPEKGKEPDRIMEGILDLASHRAGPGDFLYLEADEPSSPRKSFDINLYRAGLSMAEIYPLLLDMACHFSVPMKDFHRVYGSAKEQILGHVAGGIDREGRDFLTLYFAQKGNLRGRPERERPLNGPGKAT